MLTCNKLKIDPCYACKRSWDAKNCHLNLDKHWLHLMSKTEIMYMLKRGQKSTNQDLDVAVSPFHLKKAFELHCPWRLNELEKLMVLL